MNSTITFEYDNETLFNEVCLLSSFMAKNLVGSDASVDEICLTDDENELYLVCVQQALPNIQEVLIKMTSEDGAFVGLDNASEKITFAIKDNGAYNPNVITVVEQTLKDCIKYGVLSEFYSICLNSDLFKIAQDKFTANLSLLNKRLFQLKKRAVGSLI